MIPVLSIVGVLALTAVWTGIGGPSAQPGPEATAQTAASQLSEADKKLAEIMKAGQTPEQLVPQLQRFIRENPEFHRLENVYYDLLRAASGDLANPARTLAIADDALSRFTGPGSFARSLAYSTKLAVLGRLKDEEAIRQVVARILETETSVALLGNAARATNGEHALALFGRAISERKKNGDKNATPSLEGLGWAYSNALRQVGRKEEALAAGLEVVEQERKTLADTEASGTDYRVARNLRMTLIDRYIQISTLLSELKQHDRALEYVALAEKYAGNASELTGIIEPYRTKILAEMGKSDLVLASYVRTFALNMNAKTYEAIKDLSKKLGKDPEQAYRTAREMRSRSAAAIPGFALKTLGGKTVTLDSLRSKATLITFFYPTCGPCNAELPHLQKLYVQYARQGMAMVAINTVPDQDGMLREWLTKGGYSFPVLLSGSRDFAAKTYGIVGYPANLILNSEGKMVFRHFGYSESDDAPSIEAEIRDLLGLKPFGEPPEAVKPWMEYRQTRPTDFGCGPTRR